MLQRKQVLKENGFQESIISKINKRINNNHSLPKLRQQNVGHIYTKGKGKNECKFTVR